MLKYVHKLFLIILLQATLLMTALSTNAVALDCNYQSCSTVKPLPPMFVKQGAGKVLSFGDSGPAIKILQKNLGRILGSKVKIDGYFGPETRSAVVRLQSRIGELRSGVVAPQTWSAIFGGKYRISTTDSPRFGDRGPLVVKVQQLLKYQGYRIVVDGVFGKSTWKAVV